jgi:hypothetical protein
MPLATAAQAAARLLQMRLEFGAIFAMVNTGRTPAQLCADVRQQKEHMDRSSRRKFFRSGINSCLSTASKSRTLVSTRADGSGDVA